MRNTNKNIGWVLGAAMAVAAMPARAGVFAELDTYMSLDKNSIEQNLYVSYSIKVNERYTIIPETNNAISYRSEGKNATTVTHGYNRISIVNKDIIGPVGDWKTDLNTRYILPTDKAQQEQGTFGIISFLATFKRSWANLDVLLRPMVNVNLQRNGYALRTTPKMLPSGKPEGNPISLIALDPVVVYKFTDKLSLGVEWLVGEYIYLLDGVTGSDGNPTRTTHRFSQTYKLSYDVIDGTTVGIYLDHDNRWGKAGEKFQFLSKAATLGLSLEHQF